jgi:L-ascorbate metabolism protein UlaG (beta-lactamase superfamily)
MRELRVAVALAAVFLFAATAAAQENALMDIVAGITWYGQSALRFEVGSTVVYGDPFQLPAGIDETALDVKAKIAIPYHYGLYEGTDGDARVFADSLRGKVRVVILDRTKQPER